jgi:hypothetical protein
MAAGCESLGFKRARSVSGAPGDLLDRKCRRNLNVRSHVVDLIVSMSLAASLRLNGIGSR